MTSLAIGGSHLYYEFTQGNDTCVVLSHGYGMSGEAWQATTSQLVAAGYSVLTYDQRCCGRSGMDFDDVTISAQGSDIAALCDHLKLQNIVLNGWSLGGAIVVDAASKLDTRVAGLVLTGGATPRYTQAEGFPHGGQAADVLGTVAAIRADRQTFLKGLYYEGVFVAAVDESVKERCYQIALQADPAADDSLGDLAELDQRDLMAALTCPALIIHGLNDGVVPIDIGRFAHSLLAHSTLHEIDDCGHAPFLEHPAEYHGQLLDFLKGIAS